MSSTSHRYGWYLAILQLFFTLGWTVYALYLPQLAATAGIAAGAIILILMLDQAVFTVCDFLVGIVTDKVTRTLGRAGRRRALPYSTWRSPACGAGLS